MPPLLGPTMSEPVSGRLTLDPGACAGSIPFVHHWWLLHAEINSTRTIFHNDFDFTKTMEGDASIAVDGLKLDRGFVVVFGIQNQMSRPILLAITHVAHGKLSTAFAVPSCHLCEPFQRVGELWNLQKADLGISSLAERGKQRFSNAVAAARLPRGQAVGGGARRAPEGVGCVSGKPRAALRPPTRRAA